MIKITKLEKEIIKYILLYNNVTDIVLINEIINKISIDNRTFSTSPNDDNLCCGFYIDFMKNNSLDFIKDLPHHLTAHGHHNNLRIGSDFLIFTKDSGIDFIEASFYGDDLLPVSLLISDNHGFTFIKN